MLAVTVWNNNNTNIGIQKEIIRKTFHLAAIVFPVIYLLYGRDMAIGILGVITLVALPFDYLRHYNHKIARLVDAIFLPLMRSEEKNKSKNLSGLSYMISGMLVTAIFFPKDIVITSWFVLIFSDGAASIIGKAYGKPLACNKKSIEGSLAFFVVTLVISVIGLSNCMFSCGFPIILISAICMTIVEFFANTVKINDNFLIPVSYCIIYTILLNSIA